MEKISSRLQEKINAAGPDTNKKLSLIITLLKSSDWDEGVRFLQEAGLQIDSMAEEIRVVSGKAKAGEIRRIAALSDVEIVEFDEQASIM